MPVTRTFLSALLLTTAMLTTAASAETAGSSTGQTAKAANQAGALVMFLTQTDPMQAGHALHFASHTRMDGHRATIVLVGQAGQLALTGQTTPASATDGVSLQRQLQAFIEAGGQVYITPFTLAALKAKPDDLIAGVGLPDNPDAVHAHMFAPGTKLLVW